MSWDYFVYQAGEGTVEVTKVVLGGMETNVDYEISADVGEALSATVGGSLTTNINLDIEAEL